MKRRDTTMLMSKKESERWFTLFEGMQKEIIEGHKRELFLQKQFINIAHLYPKVTHDFKYCDECRMFHYPGQHLKKDTVEG
jgi:hypothetical protein